MNTHTEDGINPNPLPRTANEVEGSNHSATSNSSLNNTVSTIRNANGCLNRTKKEKQARARAKIVKKGQNTTNIDWYGITKRKESIKGIAWNCRGC